MENQDINSVDIMKEISSKWAHLDSQTKKQYEAMALKGQEQYNKQMEIYNQQNGSHSNTMDYGTPPQKQRNFIKIVCDLEKFKTSDSPNKSVANSNESYPGT